jgi:hypothetical protein
VDVQEEVVIVAGARGAARSKVAEVPGATRPPSDDAPASSGRCATLGAHARLAHRLARLAPRWSGLARQLFGAFAFRGASATISDGCPRGEDPARPRLRRCRPRSGLRRPRWWPSAMCTATSMRCGTRSAWAAPSMARGHWSGGALWVVQVGDLLDRGDEEDEILALLDTLDDEALAAGGRLFVLNGNHEVMNAQGDFRYVTAEGFDDFDGYGDEAPRAVRTRYGRNERGRAAAFAPGGPLARTFASHPTVMKIGDTIFVHGGLTASATPRLRARSHQRAKCASTCLARSDPLSVGARAERTAPPGIEAYARRATTAADVRRALGTAAHDASRRERLVIGHTVQDRAGSTLGVRRSRVAHRRRPLATTTAAPPRCSRSGATRCASWAAESAGRCQWTRGIALRVHGDPEAGRRVRKALRNRGARVRVA